MNELVDAKTKPLKLDGHLHLVALFLFIISYGLLLIIFVGHDNLSSFGTDSANYIVMAQFLSPWQQASIPIELAWPQQDYPILFPLILALLGAGHNFYWAHCLTAFFLILSLPLIYIYAQQILKSKLRASLIVVILSLSPSAWINSLGILSENLYILLTLITIYYYNKIDTIKINQLLIFGLLLASLVLTRTIGICMLAAFITISILQYYKHSFKVRTFLIPFVIFLSTVIFSQLFHKTIIPSQYIEQFSNLINSNTASIQSEYSFLQQIKALTDAWFVSWLYYWNINFTLPYIIFSLLGILSFFGLTIRLMALRIDAYYLVFYLIILLVWPHPGQAGRFIYPVLFIILTYSFLGLDHILKSRWHFKKELVNNLILLSVLTSIVPSLSYTWNRYNLGQENGYQHYKEFYSMPDYNKAKESAAIQSTMHRDLKKIKTITKNDEKIMFFIPAYIALLVDRIGLNIDFVINKNNTLTINRKNEANYVYLSTLHPRKTNDKVNGLYAYKYFKDWTNLEWVSYSSETGKAVSYFLKIK